MGTTTLCPACGLPTDLPADSTYICAETKKLVLDSDLARVVKIAERTMEKGDQADGNAEA